MEDSWDSFLAINWSQGHGGSATFQLLYGTSNLWHYRAVPDDASKIGTAASCKRVKFKVCTLDVHTSSRRNRKTILQIVADMKGRAKERQRNLAVDHYIIVTLSTIEKCRSARSIFRFWKFRSDGNFPTAKWSAGRKFNWQPAVVAWKQND